MGRGPYRVPHGFHVVRLQAEKDVKRREELLREVHALLRLNYGSYAESESPGQWLASLAKSGLDASQGLKLMVSAVVDSTGKLVGFSSQEVLAHGANRYVLNGYTCGVVSKPDSGPLVPADPEHYEAILWAVKHDAALAVAALQKELMARGAFVQASFQEHKTDNESHRPKIKAGFAIGQVPLSAAGLTGYQIPVYPADVQGSFGAVDPALLVSSKKEGTHAELFMGDLHPCHPAVPLATTLREFATAYATAHSVYAPKLEDDPGYRTICGFAEKVAQRTYADVYAQAFKAAPAYLGLDAACQGRSPADHSHCIVS
jgi:hypothetical protein